MAGSTDGLFELAVENLRRSTTEALQEARPGLCSSPLGDEYDAAHVLLAERADLLAARSPDVAVAALGTVDSETTPRVVAVVTEGSTVHLPKADVVSRDGGATTEPWDSFASRHAAQLAPVEETAGQWFRFAPS